MPADFKVGTSFSGTMPPSTIGVSSPASRAAATSLGASVRWPPLWIETPIASASSSTAARAMRVGGLAQPEVDDLHARVAEDARHDLQPAVVTVEAQLGQDDADRSVHGASVTAP